MLWENEKGKFSQLLNSAQKLSPNQRICEGGNKWNKETLAQRLEEGANVVKSVYRSVVQQVRSIAALIVLTCSELPSYDHVIPALLRGGIQGLRVDCRLSPGAIVAPVMGRKTLILRLL